MFKLSQIIADIPNEQQSHCVSCQQINLHFIEIKLIAH